MKIEIPKFKEFEDSLNEIKLTAMEYEAIADWFNENTNIEVININKENKFKIKQLWIFIDKESKPGFLYKYERNIVAGPFVNMKQAKHILERFKKMEGTTFYDKNKLIIDEKKNEDIIVTLDKLIAFARINGIKVNIKNILNSKKL